MSSLRLEVESVISTNHLNGLMAEAKSLYGLKLDDVKEVNFYKIHSDNDTLISQISERGHEVFCDPIMERWHASEYKLRGQKRAPDHVIEIGYLPGVTDNTGHSAEDGLALLDIKASVYTGKVFFMWGALDHEKLKKLAARKLGNTLIQSVTVERFEDFEARRRFENVNLPTVEIHHSTEVKEISLDRSDDELIKLSHDNCLALTLEEIHHIKAHYMDSAVETQRKSARLPKWPTDVELEVIAQTWSEHCKHKIFAAEIEYEETAGIKAKKLGDKKVNSLYKTYIKKATRDIETGRKIDWLKSVFSDNAGVVRFDDKVDLCIKAETHNSPSALDPYGGALTGILGVNRDILGVGMGAKPVANTDVFCFGPSTWPLAGDEEKMPVGLMNPRQIFEGVHKGVEDGGNKSGIPTVNGAIFFDQDYSGKPLVFCGTVGVMPQKIDDDRDGFGKFAVSGDKIAMIGGAIGADGIHGATFSSLELNESSPATAVQIGDPLTQKRVLDFLLEARDLGLYSSITDNGAGGLSSSIGEMATATGGATLDLKKCPVKYPGLAPWELMISESQERMSLAVPGDKEDAFLALAKKRGVEATIIGEFNHQKTLDVYYGDQLVARLDLDFLHESLPQMKLSAKWDGSRERKTWINRDDRVSPGQTEEIICNVLSRENVASKEYWVNQYDHEVQASTHIKPFQREDQTTPGDSGVIWLYPHGGEKDNAVSIGCGLSPRTSLHDPYYMAQFSVDEAVRNIVATGGDIDHCCLLDNFCWPDPVKTQKNADGDYKLGQLVRTCEGLYDICTHYGTPLVSGKDSMKNDFRGKNGKGDELTISILPTLLVTSMAKAKMGATVTSDFKKVGDFIYLLGDWGEGLLGSEFAEIYRLKDGQAKLPEIDLEKNLKLYRKMYELNQKNLLNSCHDISDGGLLTAIAEATFSRCFGADLNLMVGREYDSHDILFNEAPGRFVVTVAPEKQSEFEMAMGKNISHLLGKVTSENKLKLMIENNKLLNIKTDKLYKAWNKEWSR